MGKIRNFLSSFGKDFWGFVILLLAAAIASFLVQILLIGAGRLFFSDENDAVMIDAIIGMLLVLPPLITVCMTNYKGDGNIIVGLLAIMGIYVSVVWYFHAGILVGCIVLLYSAIWRLHKAGADTLWLGCGAYSYVCYSIGAYFAMIFNGLEPAINIYGIITLIVATMCIFFIPASE